MKRLENMLQMQQSLNDATGGKDWIQGFTDKGKPIDWRRCIYMEAAELMDSYPWKHWKNIDVQPDWDNIKIEVVDIWHFVMSEAIRDYRLNNNDDLSKLAAQMAALPQFANFKENTASAKPVKVQIDAIENLLKTLFTTDDVLQLVDSFFKMSAETGIFLPELYPLYLGKNVLNKFRQDHGYKEGRYLKNWDGMEDNVKMQALLKVYPAANAQELYQLLEQAYQTIQKY